MAMAFALKPGYSWNPLLKIPRNMACPCKSGKKFKACHLDKLPRAIPTKIADQFKRDLKQIERVVFVEDEKATQPNP